MLTHMHFGVGHLVVLAHLQRRWSSYGREGFGFLSPSHRACSAGFSAFEKMKGIFSIAPMEFFGKSREWAHQMECAEAPDASGALSKSGLSSRVHWTLCTGRRGSTVCASGVCWGQQANLWSFLTTHRTHRSESGAQRPVLMRFADLSAYRFGEYQTR